MSLMISEQTEARIAEEAQKQSVSVDVLLARLMDECAVGGEIVSARLHELPVWNLGQIGSLRRGDLYDDAD